ncbi:MAG: hypothetical protein WBD05_06860 [Phycisphaerae bacterium]
MKKLMSAAIAIVLAAGLSAAPALASDTATVKVTITVLPYAQVLMDVASVQITLPPEGGYVGPVKLGGTITCNVPATIYAHITKPVDAPGDWTAQPAVRRVESRGVHYWPDLLWIEVWSVPPSDEERVYGVNIVGASAGDPSEITPPGAGVAVLTVIPD